LRGDSSSQDAVARVANAALANLLRHVHINKCLIRDLIRETGEIEKPVKTVV
jgi:hypothetical protein